MKVHCIAKRFNNAPDDIGIPQANIITGWHLHQPGEPIDAQIEEPDRWGKSAYPVNFDGLSARTPDARRLHTLWKNGPSHKGRPLVLEMEVGRQVFDYRSATDRLALEHIGKVVGALGGVDCVYGNGWGFHLHLGDEMMLESDLAAYALIGCPDRLAITAYGKWSHQWAPSLAPKIARAKRLADAIKWKPVCPVLFTSPFVYPEGDMTVDEWRVKCQADRNVAEETDSDLMIWWDGVRVVTPELAKRWGFDKDDIGTKQRMPYEYAVPYITAAKEVLL